MSSSRRLLSELKESQKHSLSTDYIEYSVNGDSLSKWRGSVIIDNYFGIPNKAFHFNIIIDCENYPIQPPKINFTSKIFHPNILFKTGEVCMDVIKESWTPAWTLADLCRAVILLINEPNCESPLNCDAGNLIRSGDIIAYKSLALYYAIN